MFTNDLTCLAEASGPETDRLDEWTRQFSQLDVASDKSLFTTVHPESAAFSHSARIHAFVLDSTYYPSQAHFGGPTIAVGLVCAQLQGSNGEKLFRSVLAGVEIASRIGEVLVEPTMGRGLRPTAVFGGIAAAITASVALDFSVAETAHALALTSNFFGGTSQTWLDGSDDWVIQAGLAASNGIAVARLVRAGFNGAAAAWDGTSGLLRALGADDGYTDRLEVALRADSWCIEDLSYKMYPACNIVQTPVKLLLEILLHTSLDDSTTIVCRLNPKDAEYPGTIAAQPNCHAKALMSVAFCLGVALTYGGLPIEVLRSPEMHPEVSAAVARVKVISDELVPELGAIIEVTDSTGRTIRRSLTTSACRATWDAATVQDHARERLRSTGWTESATNSLFDTVVGLRGAETIDPLMTALNY